MHQTRTRDCQAAEQGRARRKRQGKELQEQDLAHPPVRPKKIVPLKVADVVLAHTETSEPHIPFASLIPQICFNMSQETQTLDISQAARKLMQTVANRYRNSSNP